MKTSVFNVFITFLAGSEIQWRVAIKYKTLQLTQNEFHVSQNITISRLDRRNLQRTLSYFCDNVLYISKSREEFQNPFAFCIESKIREIRSPNLFKDHFDSQICYVRGVSWCYFDFNFEFAMCCLPFPGEQLSTIIVRILLLCHCTYMERLP